MGLAYRGGKDEGWSYDEWLWLGRWVRLGVWEGEWVGGRCVSGVGIGYGKLWMYPHSATPRIPTQSPYNTKSSPPTAYARLARPHFHHLAQTHILNTN